MGETNSSDYVSEDAHSAPRSHSRASIFERYEWPTIDVVAALRSKDRGLDLNLLPEPKFRRMSENEDHPCVIEHHPSNDA